MQRIVQSLIVSLLICLMSISKTYAADSREDEIKKVLFTQQAAWNKGDIPSYMKGYWNSPELTFVSGGSITYGWKETLERYLKKYDTKEKVGVLNFEDLNVRHLSNTHSLAAGIWRLNRKNGESWGRFSLVFKKINNEWVIIYDHTSISS